MVLKSFIDVNCSFVFIDSLDINSDSASSSDALSCDERSSDEVEKEVEVEELSNTAFNERTLAF